MSIPTWFGPYGRPALAHADRFAALGADAVWFHGFDETAFELCDRHGITACVELPTFRADLDRRPELTPVGVDGAPIRYGELVQGVCLSRTEFIAEIEQDLVDGLRAFDPAGVWLDYLTGAGWFETPAPDLQDSCFCGPCVARFCDTTGIDATDPRQIVAHHLDAWITHRCALIAGFAARYAAMIRQHRPGCVVGIYTCPWTPDEHGGALRRVFAQDHRMLAESVDVFTPLVYGTKSGRPASWGRELLDGWPTRADVPDGAPVQLIVDALDGPGSLDEVARATIPSHGLQVFSGARLWEDDALGAAFTALATSSR